MQNRGETSPSSPSKSDAKQSALVNTNRKNRAARQERINKLFGNHTKDVKDVPESSSSKTKESKLVHLGLDDISGRNLRSSKPSIGK